MNDESVYTFETKKGHPAWIRPLQADDTPLLIELFAYMSPESRYQRFQYASTEPDPEFVWREAEKLARIGPEQGAAWLAFVDFPEHTGVPAGGVRYMFVSEGVAELAVTVRDDMQRLGIGSHLLRFALRQAREQGVRRLVAQVRRDNKAVWQLLRSLEIPFERTHEGSNSYVEVELDALPDELYLAG